MIANRIIREFSIMDANVECLYKRVNRYAKGGCIVDLVEAVNRLDRMQECIGDIRKEITDEIKRITDDIERIRGEES